MKDKERSMCVLLRINVRPRFLFPILVALTVGAATLLSVTPESGTAAAITSKSNKTRPEPRYHDPHTTINEAIQGIQPGIETAYATEMHLSRSFLKDFLERIPAKLDKLAKLNNIDKEGGFFWLHRVYAEYLINLRIKVADNWLKNAANKRLDGHMRRLIDRFTLWVLRRNLRSTLRNQAQSAETADKAIDLFRDAVMSDRKIKFRRPEDPPLPGTGRAILSGKDEQGNYKWYNIVESDGNMMVHDAQAPDQESGYFYLLREKQFPYLKDVKIMIFTKSVDEKIERMIWQQIVADSTHPDSEARKKYELESEAAAAVGESPGPSDPQLLGAEKVKKPLSKFKSWFSRRARSTVPERPAKLDAAR